MPEVQWAKQLYRPGSGGTHLYFQDLGDRGRISEFKAPLAYTRLILSKRETEFTQRWSKQMGSQTFNPSTREVKTEVIWLGREGNIRGKRQQFNGLWSVRIRGDRISPLQSEDLEEVKGLSTGWLLCFSDVHVELQYLSTN